MILIGGLLGLSIGALLAGGLVAVSGLPVYGPASAIVAAILAAGPAGIVSSVLTPIITLAAAGLAMLVATIFVYAWCAVSLLGVTPAPAPAPPALPAPAGELVGRGVLIGMASSVNFLVLSAIPTLSIVAVPVLIITLLSLVPPIAANRVVYQPILGLVGWILPLNYLMLPIGILLFIVNAPTALGAIRFDVTTMTIETRGGALVAAFYGAAPPGNAFNVGNFTFLAPSNPPGTAFGAASISAHETGHTLTNAAFGGFFYWIDAIDENIAPARGPAAYGELLPESHFGSGFVPPNAFLPMW